MVKGNADLRFFLLLIARLRFGYPSDDLRILGHNNFTICRLQIFRDLSFDFVTSLHFFRVDAFGQLDRNNAARRDSGIRAGLWGRGSWRRRRRQTMGLGRRAWV